LRIDRIERSDDGTINYAGLLLVINLLEKAGLDRVAERHSSGSFAKISNFEILAAYCCLLAQGKSDYEQVRIFKGDKNYLKLTGLKSVPSAETLRQRLDAIGRDSSFVEDIKKCVFTFLNAVDGEPGSERVGDEEYVRLDIDTVPYDNSETKKEGIGKINGSSRAGYNPIFAHLGVNGWMINAALRPGNYHSHNPENVDFIRESVGYAIELAGSREVMVVLDAGFDSQEMLELLEESSVKCVVKHNVRRTNPIEWAKIAKEHGRLIKKEGYTEKYRGSFLHSSGRRLVFEVVLQYADRRGQLFIVPKVTIFSVWTNIEAPEEEILKAYKRRGTSEQYHSEVKTEIGIERFPSGKFLTNHLILILAMLVYNVLRFIGNDLANRRLFGLRKATRRRLRTVIQGLMYMAGRIVAHSRQVVLKLKAHKDWYYAFCRLYSLCCA